MNTRRRATTILPSCWTATPHRDEQAERCSSHSAQRPRGGADGVNLRWREDKRDAKDHTIPVVRRRGRGGDEFLCLGLQEFKGCARVSLRSSGARTEGDRHVRDIPTRWTRLLRAKRGSALHLFAGYIVLREL